MADSDETATIADSDDAAWVAGQRKAVEIYLQAQGCEHAGVSLEPRWFLPPYLAIWAVRSPTNPDLVGWWAISGDVPTDYLSAARELRSTADVMSAFGERWTESAEAMSRGEHRGIGKPEDATAIAPLLHSRATVLQEFAAQIRADEAATESK